MTYFEKNLRRLAKERGLSNAEVARRCGIEARTYANYCTGKRRPDLKTLVRICRTMGVSPNELLLEEAYDLRTDDGKWRARVTAALSDFSAEDVAAAAVALEAVAEYRRELIIRNAPRSAAG